MLGQNHQQVHVNPKILNVLAKQQNELINKPPDCVIFVPNADGDVLDMQADIIGPVGTPYEGGIFKCKLVIDSEFPQKPPKGYFLTKIFHPNVAQPSGEICVNTLKKDWNPASWSLTNIFEVIKCLLIVPFPESSLNEEAGREFMENYDDFFKNAKLYTSVHAKPSQAQQRLIEQHLQSHYKVGQKEEQKHESHSQCSQNEMNFSQNYQQSQPGKEFSVLSQVTNSFIPTQAIEGKGDIFSQQDGMSSQTKGPSQPQKKATAAADSKKKWMRRI